MINVTQGLKHTLQRNPHIQEVYFDKFGNHFFEGHPHKDTGVLYHRIKNLGQKEIKGGTEKKVQIYEAHPDHELVDTLSAYDVLATPVKDAPVFQDKESSKIFEQQSQEYAKLKAENEDLKKSNADKEQIDQLKSELAKANEEKELLTSMLEDKEKENTESAKAEADSKDKKVTK